VRAFFRPFSDDSISGESFAMEIQKITPFLWFDTQAEEAAAYYAGIFPNSKVVKVVRNGEAGPGPKGSALTVEFQLADKG
jgi:predicted 3-demethylubiquinone-9 3-methyltransferase (glyoxalase superfamily)